MFCTHCGKEVQANARFCSVCGAAIAPEVAASPAPAVAEPTPSVAPPPTCVPVVVAPAQPTEEQQIAKEKACLDAYYRFLKYERLSWKIVGIVMLVFSIFFLAFGFIFFIAALAADEALIAFFSLCAIYGLVFLPIAIVGLKMVKKVEYYMDSLYTDVRPTIVRSESIGMIVLEALFNEIALIFFIINFVRTKTNKVLLQRIVERQQLPPM